MQDFKSIFYLPTTCLYYFSDIKFVLLHNQLWPNLLISFFNDAILLL